MTELLVLLTISSAFIGLFVFLDAILNTDEQTNSPHNAGTFSDTEVLDIKMPTY